MKKSMTTVLSSLYGTALHTSQALYRSGVLKIHKVGARVISIGNITWGGTGKTPFAIKLAKDIAFHYKKRVAVLTRGYGQDEVLLLQKKLQGIPVIVGRDRVRSANEAIKKFDAEIIILDDAFQHIRLHRDIDIVAINATVPFGPGGLIPCGTLREPIENLKRAHLFVLTKSDIGSKNLHWIRQKLVSIKPDAAIFESVHRPVRFINYANNRVYGIHDLKGHKVAAISGIGDPHSFERTIEKLGAHIVFAARFDDHHTFTRREINHYLSRCRELGVREIITTEKDYLRLAPLVESKRQDEINHFSILVLQVEFQISDEENFIRRCVNP